MILPSLQKQANVINHYEPLPFSYQQPPIDQENTVSPNTEPIYAELSEVVESFTSAHSNSTVHPTSNSDYFTDNSNPQVHVVHMHMVVHMYMCMHHAGVHMYSIRCMHEIDNANPQV